MLAPIKALLHHAIAIPCMTAKVIASDEIPFRIDRHTLGVMYAGQSDADRASAKSRTSTCPMEARITARRAPKPKYGTEQ